jgi:hypothetical protein
MAGRFIGIASLLSLGCMGGPAFRVHIGGPAFPDHTGEPGFRDHTGEPAFRDHTGEPAFQDYKDIHTPEPDAQD